tara:strand:- start:1210 stop:1398 length:189 start_codon:yes stop_codon:yes gene_type:complete
MSFVLQLNDTPPLYWVMSSKIAPVGHWGERTEAIQFAREKDATAFMNIHLRHQAEQCKVIEV